MKHAFLLTPQHLNHFAETAEDVRGSIPELFFRLLATSIRDAVERRLPFGRDVNQPGMDGFLETPTGFNEFVPPGKSFWEIGTGKNPRAKANADYRTRTKSKDIPSKEEFTLVLVTPRTHADGWTEAEQQAWIEAKRTEGPWKDIRVMDGTQICHWLAFHPSIEAWLVERMRLARGPITSPVTHWENIQSRGDRPLSPEVFLVGRDIAKKDVLRVLTGELRELRIRTLQPREAVDFISAALASEDPVEGAALSGRTLLIEQSDTWKDLCELRDSHVLIPHGALDVADQGSDLLALAFRKGHRVIFPTQRVMSGKHANTSLKNPKRFELQGALQKSGFTEPRSQQLAPKTLERRLADDPDFFSEVLRAVFKSDKDAEAKELTDQEEKIATAAYKLLRAWRTLPGGREDGSVNPDKLNNWLDQVMRICGESGHRDSALSEIGRVFAYHESDPDGLWLPRTVASVLNKSTYEEMRHAFIREKRNQRGVYNWTAGKEEKEIATRYDVQAQAAEKAGFRNLANAMRDLARSYAEDAERETARDPYEDW